VMLVMMDVHRLGIDVRLQRIVGVGQRREGEWPGGTRRRRSRRSWRLRPEIAEAGCSEHAPGQERCLDGIASIHVKRLRFWRLKGLHYFAASTYIARHSMF
jgi:hypothetical protein